MIVADNGSTDDSVAITEGFQQRLPNLRIVDASARQGPSYARNVGARAAIGDALAFCDADDEVGSGWLAAMGEALRKHDLVACRTDMHKLNPPWATRARGLIQQDGLPRSGYPPYLPHAGGGTLGIRRSLHESVGGFHESLQHLHDNDYCFRLQLAGAELHFVPDAVMHIRFRHSLWAMYRQSRGWAEYEVLLSKRYQSLGVRKARAWRSYLAKWPHLLRRPSLIRSRSGRARLAWQLGWQIGLLYGSIKHKTPPV